MASLARATARGAGVTLGAQGARFALQIVSLVVLARLLTPAQFGLVAMVTAVTGVAELVRDFGLSSAAIQAKTLSRGERDNLTWANTGIGFGCALVTAALAPVLAWAYGEPEVIAVTLALSWLFVVSGLNTQYRADLSRDLRFGALAITDIVAQTLSIAVAITAAWWGAGHWAIVAQQITLICTMFLTNLYFCRWLPGRPRRDVSIRKFFRYGASVFGTQVLGYSINNVDNVAIGAAWGAAPLGLYSRGYQLIQVPLNQINAPLSRVSLPVLSRLQDEPARLQRYVDRFQLLTCYVLGFGFSVAAGLSAPLIAVLFGPRWAEVALIFAVLAAGGVFKCFGQVPYQVFLATGKTGVMARFYLVSRPIMLVVILAGLPWGPVGIAVGHLIAAFGSWFASLAILARHTGLNVWTQFWQTVRALILVCAPAAGLAHVVAAQLDPHVGPVVQLIAGGLAALAWLGLTTLCIRPLRRDASQVIDAVKAARRRGE